MSKSPPQQPEPVLSFEGQRKDETVRLIIRSFPFDVIKTALVQLLLLTGAGFIWQYLTGKQPDWTWTWLILVAPLILALLLLGRRWLIWHLTRLFVTDQRLVFHRYEGLLHKRVVEIDYNWLIVVKYKSIGLFETLLSLGTIKLEVLNKSSSVFVRSVRHPDNAISVITSIAQSRAGEASQAASKLASGQSLES